MALTVCRQCPLVLLVKTTRRQVKQLETKEVKRGIGNNITVHKIGHVGNYWHYFRRGGGGREREKKWSSKLQAEVVVNGWLYSPAANRTDRGVCVCVCVEHKYHHMWRVSTNAITKSHTPSLVHKVTIHTYLGRYSYSLQTGRTGDRTRWGARNFGTVETGTGAHTASSTMGTASLSRGYSGRGVASTTHHHLAPRLKKGKLHLYPLWVFMVSYSVNITFC